MHWQILVNLNQNSSCDAFNPFLWLFLKCVNFRSSQWGLEDIVWQIIWKLLCWFLSLLLINRRHRSLSITFSARSTGPISNGPPLPSSNPPFSIFHFSHSMTSLSQNVGAGPIVYSVWTPKSPQHNSHYHFHSAHQLNACGDKFQDHFLQKHLYLIFYPCETISMMKILTRAYLMRAAWGFDIP